jgi:hypothetical protein
MGELNWVGPFQALPVSEKFSNYKKKSYPYKHTPFSVAMIYSPIIRYRPELGDCMLL